MTLGKSSGFIWLIVSDRVIACKLKYSTGLVDKCAYKLIYICKILSLH